MCQPLEGRRKKRGEDVRRQSGQGDLSEGASFKLKPEGGGAVIGIAHVAQEEDGPVQRP